MDDNFKIPPELFNIPEHEIPPIEDDGEWVSLSDALDNDNDDGFCRDEAKIKLDILAQAAINASKIYDLNFAEEAEKKKWRIFFIVFFCVLLLLSLVFVSILIIRNAYGSIKVPNEIIMGLFVYVIANIFSILYFMIKYTNNTQYLEMFKIVTHKMLDYLVEDKNASHNGKQG